MLIEGFVEVELFKAERTDELMSLKPTLSSVLYLKSLKELGHYWLIFIERTRAEKERERCH